MGKTPPLSSSLEPRKLGDVRRGLLNQDLENRCELELGIVVLAQAERELDVRDRFVCTIKFQGETDHKTVDAFAKIPGSRLLHLHHNRHELTWIKLD